MAELQGELLALLTKYVSREWGLEEGETVVSYHETTKTGGYCETCWYEDQVVVFVTSSGREFQEYLKLHEILKEM